MDCGEHVLTCDACATDPRGICFKHKLQTLQFNSIVPGGYKRENSRTYYDSEALRENNFPTTEEGNDIRSDFFKILREGRE